MSIYSETARGIQEWLAGLQIKQKSVPAKISDGQFSFKLQHPVQREIELSHPVTPELFSEAGIALQVESQSGDAASLRVHDFGGIFDPIDGRVQGEHYATTHFALLSALLFQETRDENYLNSARDAIAFHLQTSPSEYQPFSEWMYHWDFQNYAFILTYRILRDYLDQDERQRWELGLRNWQTNYKNTLTNWAGMRAWAFAERHELFHNLLDRAKINWNMRYVRRACSADGCFDDNVGLSRPIQYHIFTVAILHRIYRRQRNNGALRKMFADGISYFLPFIDPDGDFNYLGRGHEQIFGYGAAIYALEAAHAEGLSGNLLPLAHKMMDYLLQFRKGNYFPLVLNERPDEERAGWYDYHHLTVYNAFLGVWLALTHELGNPSPEKPVTVPSTSWVSEPTQTAIVVNENYFTVFSGGLSEYLCEPGITPQHLWWKDFGWVFSCPGGPTPDRFGERTPGDFEKNLLAPIARNGKGWIAPARKSASVFEKKEDQIFMSYDCGAHELRRQIQFNPGEIIFEDEIVFQEDVHLEELRLFNLPVASARFEVVAEEAGRLFVRANGRRLVVAFDEDKLPLEFLETMKTAKGEMQTVSKRLLNFEARRGESKKIRFRIFAEDA